MRGTPPKQNYQTTREYRTPLIPVRHLSGDPVFWTRWLYRFKNRRNAFRAFFLTFMRKLNCEDIEVVLYAAAISMAMHRPTGNY
jgi:hypothetical protein